MGPNRRFILFSLTGMENIFASACIAFLMASMSVSAESYDESPDGPHSVMLATGETLTIHALYYPGF